MAYEIVEWDDEQPLDRAQVAGGHLELAAAPAVYRPQQRRARAMKRAEDLVIGVPLLVLSLPLQAAVALAVKVDSRGPALFRQQRVGRDGRMVDVIKFRSMCVDAEDRLRSDPDLLQEYVAGGFKLHTDRDPRTTRIGRWLRKSSLDELPQLWSVVRGDLSLVGPRPVLAVELARMYGKDADRYLAVKPGLTGPWQVAGRSHVTFEGRVALDADYVERWSLRRDLAILLRTIPAVLTCHGAH